MGTVHRNGLPPRRFRNKFTLEYPDYEWNEDRLINWARENCHGAVQYDFVMFQGPERLSKKTIELTVWFEKKSDAVMFKSAWPTQ